MVRPFRQMGGTNGGHEMAGQQGNQGGGNQNTRLAELQKQIVIATWKLQRDKKPATAQPK